MTAQVNGIEWLLLLVVIAALLLFGPQKIPQLMRGIGRAFGEFRRGKLEVEQEIEEESAFVSVHSDGRRNRGDLRFFGLSRLAVHVGPELACAWPYLH